MDTGTCKVARLASHADRGGGICCEGSFCSSAPASGNSAGDAGGGVARRSTLALDADSPAIDADNFLSNDPTDQRGRKRVSGLAPDSGACELQTEASFANGFDPD